MFAWLWVWVCVALLVCRFAIPTLLDWRMSVNRQREARARRLEQWWEPGVTPPESLLMYTCRECGTEDQRDRKCPNLCYWCAELARTRQVF